MVDQVASWHRFETGEFMPHKYLRLLIIDEADRLPVIAYEYLRELHRKTTLSIMLISSPGTDRRIKRIGFGQLHSEFSLGYEIEPLSKEEMQQFISHKWLELGLPSTADDLVSTAIMKIAGGNFRSLNRIFGEMKRLQKHNCLPIITTDFIEAARHGLMLAP
jgi:DNA transposition AAA+ family ATPase